MALAIYTINLSIMNIPKKGYIFRWKTYDSEPYFTKQVSKPAEFGNLACPILNLADAPLNELQFSNNFTEVNIWSNGTI